MPHRLFPVATPGPAPTPWEPHEQLLEMHHRALTYLTLAVRAYESGAEGAFEQCLMGTQQILLALPEASAKQVEGPLAKTLAELYRLCLLRLCRALHLGEVADVELVRLTLGRLLRGWLQALGAPTAPHESRRFLLEPPLTTVN